MARAEKKQQEVATRDGNGGGVTISEDMLAELIADAGAGISTAAEDNLVPIILLLQDMSPVVKKRDPNYIDGAEAGMYFNRATQQLWAGDKAMSERTGLPILEFQFCYQDKAIVEWVPRTEGGGFMGRFPLEGDVDTAMRKIGARRTRDPNDPNKPAWKTSDGNNDLIETRYIFGHTINNDKPQPAVIPFSSTGHTTAKSWMTLASSFMTEVAHPQTGELTLIKQPIWWHRYIVGSKARENKKGSFFVGTVADGKVILNTTIRLMGKAMYEAAKAGTIKAGAEDYAGDNGGEVSDEI